ncbi:MAG: hypothetical protein HZA30_04355 [Candidatus Omnitrophica bacterium]|nr:hypothetical protein [Candidatus Omnitrophota bacterium]
MMKRALALVLIFFILVNLTGCETMRKKFTRKKKEPVKMPRIYQVRKYEKKPTPELYKKHYAFWTSWQSELISVLGQNHKKDMRCIEEIIGNLSDMQNILVQEKAGRLKTHIDKLVKVKDIIFNEELTQWNKDYVKRTLEREDRAIKREFSYKKVKDYLKVSYEDGA